MKASVPKFEIGDTVDVHVRILEGEKERIQIFNGVVIARSGTKTREMFVVRRIVQGEGVERKFPLHSPRIADIVVKRSGKVRRAKLYYLREPLGQGGPAQGAVPRQQGHARRGQGRQGRAPRQKAAAKKARAEAAAEAKAEAEAEAAAATATAKEE